MAPRGGEGVQEHRAHTVQARLCLFVVCQCVNVLIDLIGEFVAACCIVTYTSLAVATCLTNNLAYFIVMLGEVIVARPKTLSKLT